VFLAKIVKYPNGKPPYDKTSGLNLSSGKFIAQIYRDTKREDSLPLLHLFYHTTVKSDTSINRPAFLGQLKQLLVRFLHIVYRFDRFFN
jgi:hypothetical protein